MLYTGIPTRWMTPDPDENEYEEANDQDTIFHLPSFIFDLNFTGKTDIPVSDYHEICSSSWPNVPAFSPEVINTFHAAPQLLDGDPILKARSKSFAEGMMASPPHGISTLLLNPPPADHLCHRRLWWLPRGHNMLSLVPMAIHPRFVREEREEIEDTHKLCVLEADIAHEQKIHNVAESHLILLPPSLPSCVFVLPPANINNEITSPMSEELVLPVSLSAHASPEHAVTAFQIIPTLFACFQSFFRSDPDPDAQDTECAEDTFNADSE
ncbi:hypothetical protein DFH08DRAFT_956863 [Mycena albidolilacea]|uniref:Uncharacterized protein n=1 Tax=Mycena albidolilacea TaxID=1033008 RepID=A0AAD7EUI4_9AGAR|nr:hypothetical protein DFH08DRAFT_956863 [Mycena albidolilacea]